MSEITAETSTIQETTETTSQDVAETQDTDVQETSTSQETETQDTGSEENTETDEKEAETKPSIDYEKQYKELQAEYTRNQQKLKELEARVPQQPQIIDDRGRVNPQFERDFAHQVEAFEYNSYRNLATQLEADVMPEVMDKLNKADNCYKMGDINSYRALMNEVKEFFNPLYIEQISAQKAMMNARKGEYIDKALKEQMTANATRLEEDLKQSSEVWELVNPDSEYFNAETFGIIKQLFDSYGSIDTQLATNAIKAIEANAIRKYKANVEAQKTAEVNKQKASIVTGDNINLNSSMPTIEQLERMSQKDYNSAVEKWGLANILSQR